MEENNKTLLKDIQEELNKWKHITFRNQKPQYYKDINFIQIIL